MRKIEVKICVKCGNPYVWEHGGIVMTPQDRMDFEMCQKCRTTYKGKTIKAILFGK